MPAPPSKSEKRKAVDPDESTAKKTKSTKSQEKKEEKKEKEKKRVWDPERSYVPERVPESKIQRPQKQTWPHKGPPILDIKKVPQGWHDDEPDLEPGDIEGHIRRCKERIRAGILPWLFEDRLKAFEAQLKIDKRLMARFPGLSFQAAQRIEILESHIEYLHKTNDKVQLLSTVENLISAYKSGKLEWNAGLVTYWSHGKQLCQPRPFDIHEFAKVNREHKGTKGFWVEGNRTLLPSRNMMAYRKLPQTRFGANDTPRTRIPVSIRIPTGVPPFAYRQNEVPVRISRVPRVPAASTVPLGGEIKPTKPTTSQENYIWMMEDESRYSLQPHEHMTFWLDDDTGADHMQLYESDIRLLQQAAQGAGFPNPDEPPLMGLQAISQANGTISTHEIRIFEVNIINDDDKELSFWDWVDAVILNQTPDPINPTRICGPWLRHRFYTGTSPDGKNRLWIHDNYTGFRHVKKVTSGRSGPVPSLNYANIDPAVRARIQRLAVQEGGGRGLGLRAIGPPAPPYPAPIHPKTAPPPYTPAAGAPALPPLPPMPPLPPLPPGLPLPPPAPAAAAAAPLPPVATPAAAAPPPAATPAAAAAAAAAAAPPSPPSPPSTTHNAPN